MPDQTKIGKRAVDVLKPGEVIWDAEIKGFGVRCQKAAKVYILKYRFGHRQRWYSIGKHGSPWTPEKARIEAKRLLGLVAREIDPSETRDAQKKKPTIAEFCTRFLDEYSAEHKRPLSHLNDKSNINNHVLPLLGRLYIADVTRADIDHFKRAVKNGKTAKDEKRGKQSRSIVTGGPGVANKCLALLSKIFNMAERWGLRPDGSNPCRHVDRYPVGKRERFLSEAEFALLADELSKAEADESAAPYAIAAIRLLIFTGARLSEILNLKWEHVNLGNATLVLPDFKESSHSSTNTKIVYLSAPALKTLSEIPRIKGNPFVICGDKEGAALVNLQKPWRRIRNKATLSLWANHETLGPLVKELTSKNGYPTFVEIEKEAEKREISVPIGLRDVRIHDLRHSFASAAASGGMSLPMIGKLLGHSQVQTTQRYAHLGSDPVKAANEAIGRRIAAAMNGEKESTEVHSAQKNGA